MSPSERTEILSAIKRILCGKGFTCDTPTSKEPYKLPVQVNKWCDIPEQTNKILNIFKNVPDFKSANISKSRDNPEREVVIIYSGATFKLFLKSKQKPNDHSGNLNEVAFRQNIQRFIKACNIKNGIKIEFIDKRHKKFICEHVINAKDVSKNTKGRKKADIELEVATGFHVKNYLISLKKSNADFWESADTLKGEDAFEILNKAITDKKIELIDHKNKHGCKALYANNGKCSLSWPLVKKEMEDVCFGSDLSSARPYSCIILNSNTFMTFDDKVLKNEKLVIKVDAIYTNVEEIKRDREHAPQWLLHNSAKRTLTGKNDQKIKGLRIEAATQKRCSNAVQVSYH